MKRFGLSLLYDWGSEYTARLDEAPPSAVAYAEAALVTNIASPTFAGISNQVAEAIATANGEVI